MNNFSDLQNPSHAFSQPGTYSVELKVTKGCMSETIVLYVVISSPEILSVSINNPVCGQDFGEISISDFGGFGQLQYSLDGIAFQASNTFVNVPVGVYTVMIVDENDCFDTQDVEIESIDAPQISSITITDATCGSPTGSLSIFSNGGTGLLEYSIDGVNFQTSSIFNNLSAGTYTVWVQDGNNCVAMENAMIEEFGVPEIDAIDTTPSRCGADDGSININASGGTGQLEYSIDGLSFQTNPNFINLSGGTYTVIVQDEFDCVASQMVGVMQTDAPAINVLQTSPVTCDASNGTIVVGSEGGLPPYNYSIDGTNFQEMGFFENLPEGGYTLIVQDSEGCTDIIQIEIELEESISIAGVEITPTSCGESNGALIINVSGAVVVGYSIDGINFQTSNSFENLAPDSYTLVVLDNNNCQETQMVIIEPSEMPNILPVDVSSTSCGDSNGTIFINEDGEGFAFSINGIDYQQENIFSNLPSGDYTLFVKDENSCISMNDVRVEGSIGFSILDLEVNSAACREQNGGFSLGIEGGTGQIQLSLNGGAFQSDSFFEGLPSGEYNIQIVDEAECFADTVIFISQVACPIYMPNAFSPNDDGVNDYFRLEAEPGIVKRIVLLRIFDRWGGEIYKSSNGSMDEISSWWNGKYRGKDAEAGIYLYQIVVEFQNGEMETLQGDVMLVR